MSAHDCTVGQSGTGKSQLLKGLAARWAAAGWGVVACDPHDEWLPHSHQRFIRWADFIVYAKTLRNCQLVIDEAAQSLGRASDGDNVWVTTGARKYGIASHLICHNPTQLYPTVRNSLGCYNVFLTSSRSGAYDLIAEEMGQPDLLKHIHHLKTVARDYSTFLRVPRHDLGPISLWRLDLKTRNAAVVKM